MPLSIKEASLIALKFAAYLPGTPHELEQFSEITGIDIGSIAQRAADRDFQRALMDYLMQNETLLVTFCAQENIKPDLIAQAAWVLENQA